MQVSVVTAVHPPRSQWLHETAASVARADTVLGAGAVQWVVVVDGAGDVELGPDRPSNMTVIHRPMNGGVSAARNTGLTAANGQWVLPLDHDDQLDPAGLGAALADSRTDTARWVAGSPRLLDGAWTAHKVFRARQFRRRELEENWTVPFPFHPNVILVRRDVALAAGGWPALSANQDIGLMFAVNRIAEGWALPYPLIRYRTWAEQTVAQDFYPDVKALDFAFLAAWVNAERAHNGLDAISRPPAGGSQVRPPSATGDDI